MKQTLTKSQSSRPSTAIKRPSSACPTPINMQKREKLKSLLVEKFIKKFEYNFKSVINKEVGEFIQKSNLTENDLKNFEEKLKKTIEELKEKEKIKLQLDQTENENSCKIMNNNFISNKPNQQEEDTKSVCSKMSDISNRNFSNKNNQGLKYEEITNFELRKLLQNEKKPIIRDNIKREDEWTVIAKQKKQQWEQEKKEIRDKDKIIKITNRQTYDSQISEKEVKKQEDRKTQENFHKTLMCTVDKLTKEEREKIQIMKEKKMFEKELRDKQIQDNIERKKNEFLNNRKFDNTLITKILNENEQQKINEQNKRIEAKESLKKMLQNNEEFKIKQKEDSLKEREQDIRFMEEYTRILEKQEQDRIEYFKKCENRQKEAMSRMAETVVKQKDLKAKEDEEKMKKYQIEKEKKDQEEEERRKKLIKDNKVMMRNYLKNQMGEKKERTEVEKNIESEQLKLWIEDNEKYFSKEKQTNEKIKQQYKNYAEFLKSQMDNKKNLANEKMSEEEFRINKDLIENSIFNPNESKRNFLI